MVTITLTKRLAGGWVSPTRWAMGKSGRFHRHPIGVRAGRAKWRNRRRKAGPKKGPAGWLPPWWVPLALQGLLWLVRVLWEWSR